MLIILCNLQFEGYVSPCPEFSLTLSWLSRPSALRRGGGRPLRGVAQLASASGLGPEGRVFESHHPDESKEADSMESWPLFERIPSPPIHRRSVYMSRMDSEIVLGGRFRVQVSKRKGIDGRLLGNLNRNVSVEAR